MPVVPVAAVSRSLSETLILLGSEVPVSLGDFAEEYRALTCSAALLPMPWEVCLEVRGRDAGSFLQNLFTQDVLDLHPGDSVAAALATRKGHLQADLRIVCQNGVFRIRLQKRLLENFLVTLDRYRITEDVEWRIEPDPQVCLLLAGPEAASLWQSLESFPTVRFMPVPEISPHDIFLTLPESDLPEFQKVLQRCASPAVPTIGWRAFNVARIETGRAWFGLDANEERLVPEPDFADRINYEKGCYLGQETLARLHYRGKLNWQLVPLGFDPSEDGAVDAKPEAELRCGDDRVGWLTSIEVTPAGRGIALGYLHRKYRESGGALSLPSGLPVSSRSTLTCRVD